jgi:nucleolar pre-ribosomal-associated protein 1
LYGRDEAEGDEAEPVPADVAHHFLLAICTRPGSGVCFKDHGWYPRGLEEEATRAEEDGWESWKAECGRVYNKILANVLRGLKANEDARQQELVLKILRACPELVAGFWSGAGLTMEPRLSSRWLANVALFGAIVSLPIPTGSFLLPGGTSQYHLSPPPLLTLLENILPSVGVKVHLSKGLQSVSAMVQHASALALIKCLDKLNDVIRAFKAVESAVEETEENGRWSARRRELELEARRRLPDFQVILAFVQQYQKTGGNRAKLAMLSEAGQRLLWLYHILLPGLVAENRFDPGKLLQQFSEEIESNTTETEEEGSRKGLETLRRLHALQLLGEVDQVVLSGKSGLSSRSNMAILLKQYVAADVQAIKFGLASLIQRQLGETLLFQHRPEEVKVWLSALDLVSRIRFPSVTDYDNDSLITFVDDCVQRCLKTPYRYLDEWEHLMTSAKTNTLQSTTQCSPLLMTVLEQIHAKIAGSHLSPSAVMTVTCFIREVVFALATANFDLAPLKECAQRVEKSVSMLSPSSLDSGLAAATKREIDILVTSVTYMCDGPADHLLGDSDHDVEPFLDHVAAALTG